MNIIKLFIYYLFIFNKLCLVFGGKVSQSVDVVDVIIEHPGILNRFPNYLLEAILVHSSHYLP